MYNIIGCEKSEEFIARQNLECHLPGNFRKAHLVQHDNGWLLQCQCYAAEHPAPGTCLFPASLSAASRVQHTEPDLTYRTQNRVPCLEIALPAFSSKTRADIQL